MSYVFRRPKDGDIIEYTISGKTPEMGSSLNPVHKVAFLGSRRAEKYIVTIP